MEDGKNYRVHWSFKCSANSEYVEVAEKNLLPVTSNIVFYFLLINYALEDRFSNNNLR